MDREPLIDYSVGSYTFLYTVVSFVAFAVARLLFYKTKYHGDFRTWRTIQFHTLQITIDRQVTIKYIGPNEESCLVTKVGTCIPEFAKCDIIQSSEDLTIDWTHYAKLTIRHGSSVNHTYDFEWTAYNKLPLEDHIMMLEGKHWYGVGHLLHQPWPMERCYNDFGAFIVEETPPFSTTFGEVQERMWLTSSGMALVVDSDVPLFASINNDFNKTIKLLSHFKSPYQNNDSKNTILSYSIIQTDRDVLAAFHSLRKSHVRIPEGIPDESMFRYPIWSTWAQYKKGITQDKVIDFAHDIAKYEFKASQIEIDDDWTPHYGDWEFDKKKFPDPKAMTQKLKGLGFRVMLWIHPFASPQSKAFKEGLKRDKHTWVRWRLGPFNLPALVSWWNGYGALLDLTNPQAVDWFLKKMEYIKDQYEITSFKVDAGEAGRLSSWTQTKIPLDNPNTYTELFADLTHNLDKETKAQEIRVGTKAQHLPMFFRLQDKDSNWGNFNGMKTVIPHVLSHGLIGYPFVLPDMIGGNAYLTGKPDKELFIRWVELNALMPSMQFSIVPWMYDDETVQICKAMCQLHEKYSDKILSLATEATVSGSPIIRPMWWIAPDDEAALTISSQFLLGDDILVAPVLERGARSRDIYLPPGTWADKNHLNLLEGGQWHRDYPAELDELPHFTKI